MSIDLYIGPVIARGGRFAYETFSHQEGLRSSFGYPRVEQAYYDRRSMIDEWQRDGQVRVHICDTLAEFERACAVARGPGGAAVTVKLRDC